MGSAEAATGAAAERSPSMIERRVEVTGRVEVTWMPTAPSLVALRRTLESDTVSTAPGARETSSSPAGAKAESAVSTLMLVGAGVGDGQGVGALAGRQAEQDLLGRGRGLGRQEVGRGGRRPHGRHLVEDVGGQPAARDDDPQGELAAAREHLAQLEADARAAVDGHAPQLGYVDLAGAAVDGDVGDRRALVGVDQLEDGVVAGTRADAGVPGLGGR